MKKEFFEFFSLSETEIKSLWKNAIFVFDANILMNLYRYSEGTKNKFIEVIEKLDSRVWFSHQSIKEYLKNRIDEIQRQKSLYTSASKDIEGLENLFDHERQHPFLPKKMLDKMKKINEEVKGELKKGTEFQETRIRKDDIRDKLVKITKDKVGPSYSEEELSKIYEEGGKRYKDKVPPGYKDIAKIAAGDGSAYGDLVVWKQIIDFAKEQKKNIIFVTDDQKEDWWLISNKKTISPRPELIREFQTATSKKIHFYQPSHFLKYVGEFLKSEVKEEVLNEVKEPAPVYYNNRGEKRTRPYSKEKKLDYKNSLYHYRADQKFYTTPPLDRALQGVRQKIDKINEEMDSLNSLLPTGDKNVDKDISEEIEVLRSRLLGLKAIEAIYLGKDDTPLSPTF